VGGAGTGAAAEVTGSMVVLVAGVGGGDGGETVLTFFTGSSLILEHVDIRLLELAWRSRTR